MSTDTARPTVDLDIPRTDDKPGVAWTAVLFVEALLALAAVAAIRLSARRQIDDAIFGITNEEAMRINGEATLDLMVVLVVAIVIMGATAAIGAAASRR